jgi:GH35 family endo-1,4-beta-xylanase
MDRREFLKTSAKGAVGATFAASALLSLPELLLKSRTLKDTSAGTLVFKPFFVQDGIGPHIYDLVWATDKNWDPFYSNINLDKYGLKISDSLGQQKFGINARWNVEGFGYTNITADNGGQLYELPKSGKMDELNLNYEFAKSRVYRNRERAKKHGAQGYIPGTEVKFLMDLSEELLEDAEKKKRLSEDCGQLSQTALMHALWASEKLELENAEFLIAKAGQRNDFYVGCDARAFYQMYQDKFRELFPPLFNYANITFVAKGDGIISDFEPKEGLLRFEIRDYLNDTLREYGMKTQGRLMFWFHDCCTHDWLMSKSYDQLLKYAEKHTRDVLKHYGDKMYAWEMVNELHDWANELQLSPEQTIELTRLITDTAKDAAPAAKRTINNCCPFAEYIQMKSYSGKPAKYRQRSPVQFTKDILDAGIDIDIVEQQMYFPYRDLQDTLLLIERYEQFNKPMHISEIGCPGGLTEASIKLDKSEFPKEPYLWHHYWDEETQSDWMEQLYTLIYSKPYIKAGNWFDFVDPYSYMENGGLLRSPDGEKKASYYRMEKIKQRFSPGVIK